MDRSILLTFVALTVAPVARAERLHDTSESAYAATGLYLRCGVGLSPYFDELTGEVGDRDPRARVQGMAWVGELAAGGAVYPRLVVGGGIWASSVFASGVSVDRGAQAPEEVTQERSLTVIGPFASYYFEAPRGRVEAFGLYAQAGVGFAVLNEGVPLTVDGGGGQTALGPGVMMGVGYDWRVERTLTLGVFVRMTGAALVEEDSRGNTWYHGAGTLPALLLAGTYR